MAEVFNIFPNAWIVGDIVVVLISLVFLQFLLTLSYYRQSLGIQHISFVV